jgi:TonB family protein
MTAEMLLTNLARYLLQSTTLVLAAAAFVRLFRIRAARVRLAIWQLVLVGSAVLPFLQPVKREFVVPAASAWDSGGAAARGTPVRFDTGMDAVRFAGIVGAAGCMARWLWLAAGLARLARRRRSAARLSDLARVRWAQDRLGVSAEFYIDPGIAGPVTFGSVRPVVLLPPSFPGMPEEAAHAVALHELLHVKRRDWLFTVGEEIIRGLLWFHPAIWWLLDRVQLAREQAVDEEVVGITRDQERYVGALLEIAAVRLQPELAPAPLFLRKRQLTERVSFLVKGGQMSKKHLYASVLAVMVLLPFATGLVIRAFPLQGAAQLGDPDGDGVQVGESPFRLLHRTPIEYPAEALSQGISGSVVADLKVNDKGEVYDAAVVSGPPSLRAAVLKSVLNWHYDLSGEAKRPEHFEVAVRFTAPVLPAAGRTNAVTPGSTSAILKKIDVTGVPAELRDRVLSSIPVHAGDRVNPADLAALRRAVTEIDEHNSVSLRNTAPDDVEVVIAIPGRRMGVTSGPAPMAALAGIPIEAGAKRIRVKGEVEQANVISKVVPVYPPLAKQARIQGTVILNALIDRQGKVKGLELVGGHPLLVESAVDAVKQWVYRPVLLNGDPVEVITEITVHFTLAE